MRKPYTQLVRGSLRNRLGRIVGMTVWRNTAGKEVAISVNLQGDFPGSLKGAKLTLRGPGVGRSTAGLPSVFNGVLNEVSRIFDDPEKPNGWRISWTSRPGGTVILELKRGDVRVWRKHIQTVASTA